MANNLTAEQLIDAMKSMNDTFVKTKKENESQVKYIHLLEEELLQLRIDNSFYESMFQEEPKAPPLGVGKVFKTRKEPLPPPPLGVGKIKKSLGQLKPYSTREPRYHMTEVARDWAS